AGVQTCALPISLAVQDDRQLSLDDVERFVLVMVDVVRRLESDRHVQGFHEEEVIVGGLTGRTYDRRTSEELEGGVLQAVDIGLAILCDHRCAPCADGLRHRNPFIYMRCVTRSLPVTPKR